MAPSISTAAPASGEVLLSKTADISSSFEFIVASNPAKLRATKAVRSRAARHGWKEYLEGRPAPARKRHAPTAKRNAARDEQDAAPQTGCVLRIDYSLGGGRVDPFRSHPGESQPFIPFLMDHCLWPPGVAPLALKQLMHTKILTAFGLDLVHMAVDIPELDGPETKGLLRTRWFPLVISELALFRCIILLAASNVASLRYTPDAGYRVLQLKANAIRAINGAFTSSGGGGFEGIGDAVIGAVAKMASFEAMHGDRESFCVHMNGVRNMVRMRGGLGSLGLGGLLRRIIVWVDINSSFLLGVPRFFPGESFEDGGEFMEPNPERFIAA